MQVNPGSRLGPYEIVSRIGAGGMGEVFKARDTRLDRSVAVKVLPAEFAANHELKLRFEREAKAISQLNHPNICTLYDVGSEGGVEYLVMELIEGESLAQRLTRGPLPLSDVLRYGAQIAEALDRAHRAGIVHRDLKPGNVMLTKSGAKLLDFGLAKATPAAVAVSGSEMTVQREADRPLTEKGTILGTFQYMAPEQLEGDDADARTDIFALGSLLYEMATGVRAFAGKTRTSLIAAIVSTEPRPLRELQPLTPPAFEHVVRKCLAKDPEQRWQSAHDVADELRWAESTAGVAAAPGPAHRSRVALVAAMLFAAITASIGWFAGQLHRTVPSFHLVMATPAGERPVTTSSLALSPDGSTAAFSASDASGKVLLFTSSLRSGQTRALAGTEGADDPFFSPDGSEIGYFTPDELKVVSLRDGVVRTIARVDHWSTFGGVWRDDGLIVFGDTVRGIVKVPAAGGTPSPVVTRQSLHASMVVQPVYIDGELYCRMVTAGTDESWIVHIGRDGAAQRIMRADAGSFSAPPGWLLYGVSGTIYAQRIDPREGRFRGSAVILGRGSRAAASGSTVVVLDARERGASRFSIVDIKGNATEVIRPDSFGAFRLSPRGTELAVEKRGANLDIWVTDLERAVSRRLTYGSLDEADPVWSPDGRIMFTRTNQAFDASIVAVTPSGGTETVIHHVPDEAELAEDVSANGDVLYVRRKRGVAGELWYQPANGIARSLVTNPFTNSRSVFSPDGHYVAYNSDESGRFEIFVVDFPNATNKWQISSDGGEFPKWSHDGRTLYFLSNGALESAAVFDSNGQVRPQKPQRLFAMIAPPGGRDLFEPMADGRFLVKEPYDATPPVLHVITGWAGE